MEYLSVSNKEAWRLLGSGGVVLVCSASVEGVANLAPVAWVSPLDYEPVSRVLFVCDPGHLTLANIRATGHFALALPCHGQKGMVEAAGSTSGRAGPKYEALGIDSFPGSEIPVRIPLGVAGWLECRLIEVIDRGTACIVTGEVVHCQAIRDAWKQRLHLASDDSWYRPQPLE